MRLTYNVLCIDDKISSLKPIQQSFRRFNNEVGIETDYENFSVVPKKREETPEEIRSRILEELAEKFDNTSYHLILVDLHMGAINGGDIIQAIRTSHTFYRPIIFHSRGEPEDQEEAITQLYKAAKKAEILGRSILITGRINLEQELKKIAKEMHKEEQKINQVRGLLMDQVSEIDAHIISITEKLWLQVPEEKRDFIIERVTERIQNSRRKYNTFLQNVEALDYEALLPYYVTNHKRCDANARAMILKRMLDSIPNLPVSGDDFLDLYDSQKRTPYISLTRLRNEYAHKTAKVIDENHDKSKCKYIRTESRKHLNNMLSLLGKK